MKQRICLNMIVKDESNVILRSLESVRPLIDYWVIVDTGSTDGTPEMIEKYFQGKGIFGELHHRKWVDFATNRNQALKKAIPHGDYLLFIDADEQFIYEKGFKLPHLEMESYYVTCNKDETIYHRQLLIRSDVKWRWVGKIHEMLECDHPALIGLLSGVVNLTSGGGGARSNNREKTREKDIRLLENLLKKEPKNSRTQFYLASTYLTVKNFDKALRLFKQRAKTEDFSEEQYLSKLYIAKLLDGSKKDPDIVFNAYTEAIRIRPQRAEAYFYLARFLRKQKDLLTAYEVAKKGMEFPTTSDSIAVESRVYTYGMALEYSVISAGLGKIEQARNAALCLLEKPNLPEDVRSFITNYWMLSR